MFVPAKETSRTPAPRLSNVQAGAGRYLSGIAPRPVWMDGSDALALARSSHRRSALFCLLRRGLSLA
jgi:hypothetical protein